MSELDKPSSVMSRERYIFLMENYDQNLTDEEVKFGWHFCNDWDGNLCKIGSHGCLCDVNV